MNRYLSSFIITAIIYSTAIAAMLYTIDSNNYSDKDINKNNIQKLSLAIVTPVYKPKKQEIKKEKTKPKPITKKTLPKREVPKEEIVKKEEIQKETQQVEKQTIATHTANNKNCDKQIKAKKDIFISNLIKQINNNKSYPMSAKRRGIEGDVDVEFTILSDGSVKDINMLLGKNVFKQSAIEAIDRSFPISVEESLFNFPKKFKIKIAYVLK